MVKNIRAGHQDLLTGERQEVNWETSQSQLKLNQWYVSRFNILKGLFVRCDIASLPIESPCARIELPANSPLSSLNADVHEERLASQGSDIALISLK